jgi:hypothetical protein
MNAEEQRDEGADGDRQGNPGRPAVADSRGSRRAFVWFSHNCAPCPRSDTLCLTVFSVRIASFPYFAPDDRQCRIERASNRLQSQLDMLAVSGTSHAVLLGPANQ